MIKMAKIKNNETKFKVRSCRNRGKTLQCYGVLSTQLIGFFVFTLYPMIWAIQKAFYYYDGVPSRTKFVGLDNFIDIFTQNATYWKSWLTTFIFMFGKLPIELPLALLVAVCLTRKLKGSGFFRAAYYLPCIMSVAIIGLIFTNMFDYFGFINAWLVKLGFIDKSIDWFGNTYTAMIVLIIGAVWNTFGTNVLYFMAAIANIPKELYESAKVDGANGWVTFWKVTLPMMSPVLQTILLLSINGTLKTSEYILVTTNGAPAGSTYTVMAYQIGKFVPGFASSGVNVGYGCAVAVVTSICLMTIALIYTRLSSRLQNMY